MRSLRVFVSSAIDELEYEREIVARAIEELNFEPVLFEGLPSASRTLEEAYLEHVRACDIFLLILWKTFPAAVEREYEEALANQKPVLIFVKLLKEGERQDNRLRALMRRLKSQDAGTASPSTVRFFKNYRTLGELEHLVKQGIIGQFERLVRTTITTTHSRRELYELGEQIVRFARKRLYIVERTPLALLGPRPYSAPDGEKIPYESRLASAFSDWIDACVADRAREFVYLYDVIATRMEMESECLGERVRSNLTQLKGKERESGLRFRFVPMSRSYSGPIAVGDDWLAMWILGEHDAVCVSSVNARLSDQLVQVLKPMGDRPAELPELLGGLGLD